MNKFNNKNTGLNVFIGLGDFYHKASRMLVSLSLCISFLTMNKFGFYKNNFFTTISISELVEQLPNILIFN